MEKVIVYASRYGSAKKYAEQLAAKKGYPLYDVTNVTRAALTDREVILIAAVYIGMSLKLRDLLKSLTPGQPLQLFTVGLTDPEATDQFTEMEAKIRKLVHEASVDLIQLQHLRGAFDYERLNFKHKLLIKALHKSASKQTEPSATDRLFMELYGNSVDYIEVEKLEELL